MMLPVDERHPDPCVAWLLARGTSAVANVNVLLIR